MPVPPIPRPPVPAHAPCTRTVSRTSLASASGRRIASLVVVREGPDPMPGPLDRLHVVTRESTLRRIMRLAPGDTVDTLRVADGFRRLRRLRYIGDARLEATTCDDAPGTVELVLVTRDEWSTKPVADFGGRGSATVGVTERNVLGTGREAGAYIRTDAGRTGVGVAVIAPWLLGLPVRGELARDAFADGGAWWGALATDAPDPRTPWRAGARLLATTRSSPDGSRPEVHQTGAQALGARRVALGTDAVTGLLMGVEYDRTRLAAERGALLVGPATRVRSFTGVDLGLARTSLAYDTLTWLLPTHRIADVPLATEGEVVVGAGHDAVAGRPAVHLDAWLGKAWLPTRRALVVGDAWATGYGIGGAVEGGALRAQLRSWIAAPRGAWVVRLGAEHLVRPDPTVRSLLLDDATAAVLPPEARLATTAFSALAERDVVLGSVTRSWAVTGALFAGGSLRWQPAARGPLAETEQVGAVAIGAGLGLTSVKAGRGGIRLDLAQPLALPPGIRPRPQLRLTLVPWFGDGRHRLGGAAPIR